MFRGIDLLDLYRGRLSIRRLKVLIEQTPGDDPMWQAIRAKAEKTAAAEKHQHLLNRAAHYANRVN